MTRGHAQRQTLADARFLKPGELIFLPRPGVVSTVLGSCVSITLFYPERALGCICHAVFPASNGLVRDWRCVDQALPRMLAYFDRRGIPRCMLKAKLFGGAAQFGEGGHQVGGKNVEAARWVMGEAGLRLSAADVGGTCGRKILFDSYSGYVFVKRFRSRHPFAEPSAAFLRDHQL